MQNIRPGHGWELKMEIMLAPPCIMLAPPVDTPPTDIQKPRNHTLKK